MNQGLRQVVVLINRKPYGNGLDIIPGDLVFFYHSLISATAVLRRGRGGEVPFRVGGAADKRDVVQVNYLSFRQPNASAESHDNQP